MKAEIRRKFLINQMPDLTGMERITYHRFYLYVGDNIDLRIQKIGDKFELERKVEVSPLTRTGEKIEISQEEFQKLKVGASEEIVRDSYLISENPKIVIRIYHGKFEGLARAELEFESEDKANDFQKPEWLGEEITNSPLGRDSKLLKLSAEEFEKLLKK